MRMFSSTAASVRMHATAATRPVAVYAVVPIPEVPLRVQLAALHSSVPGVRAEPADASLLLSPTALRRPKNMVVTYVAL